MHPQVTLRPERPEDIPAIARLHDAAFGPDEPIAALVARLRSLDAPFPTRSIVACDPSGQVLGHVMLSHAWLDAPERLVDIWLLSPLGVAPQAQGQGIGSALVAEAIRRAGQTTAPFLVLEGDPVFYRRCGFESAASLGLRRPSLRTPEAAQQAVRLPVCDPKLTGSIVYRDLWWEMDAVGLR